MPEHITIPEKNNTRSNSGLLFGTPFFQPKRNINQPNDPYEQEADAIAEKVIRKETPVTKDTFFSPLDLTTGIQRQCADCEEEELQRKENNTGEVEAGTELESYVGNINSGGTALPNNVRGFFEPRFGYDFSNVKVHTDNIAAKSAQSINALAYTSGNDIVFNKNQYSPETDNGKKLLAHELTHVVQQNADDNLSRKIIQRYDDPLLWCNPFMDLIRYEDAHGKWGVITHYHSLSNENLIPLNRNIPSIFGEVDVDWMFRLAFIQYPFILTSIITPSMSEGFGSLLSRVGQVGLKGFWNTVRAAAPEWELEYGSILEEGNWNSSTAIVAWVHKDLSLRDIFAPAISLC